MCTNKKNTALGPLRIFVQLAQVFDPWHSALPSQLHPILGYRRFPFVMSTLSAKEENLKMLVDAHQRQRSKSQSQVRYTPEPEEVAAQPMNRPRRFSFQNVRAYL